MEVLTKKHEKIISLFRSLNCIASVVERLKEQKPMLNGEYYLTDKQLSKKLNISRRSLQDYRTQGILSYIKLGGKILYKESDINKLLTSAYCKAWRNGD